jgi:hypothetical protein
MSLAVVGETSVLQCSFGTTPSPLIVLPDRTVMAEGMLMGNILDFIPLANIEPFGLCRSKQNPAVKAAIKASAGTVQTAPCVPATVTPWVSEALTVMVMGAPAIDQTAMLMCTWAGIIRIVEPGNFTVMVP